MHALARHSGSSPLARGTLEKGLRRQPSYGIIPACAGNTGSPRSCCSGGWDHPRLRGEHRLGMNDVGGPAGIIPACAGNTTSSRLPSRDGRDHPRLRGEHQQHWSICLWSMGSSPLARGTQGLSEVGDGHVRIIPACAGNTGGCSRGRRPARDHPRLRGEHVRSISWMWMPRGSSPLARGTPNPTTM